MIRVDCGEMTLDEQLALAAALSDSLAGRGVALVKDSSIVLDELSPVSLDEVAGVCRGFTSKRSEAGEYSVEERKDVVVIHTPDPLARSRGRKDAGQLLPDNLFKCPFCPFVTPHEELYVVHCRSHGFF